MIILAGNGRNKVWAAKNPAAVYCEEMGYEAITKKDNQGNETAYCQFNNNGDDCDAFAFFSGKCGRKHSYCEKNGWDTVIGDTVEQCGEGAFTPCSLCVDEKREVKGEVSQLMNLDYRESFCGDGECSLGEEANCPEDCKSEKILEEVSGEIPFLMGKKFVKDNSCQPCLGGRKEEFICIPEKPRWEDFKVWGDQYLRTIIKKEALITGITADYNCDGKVDLKDLTILWKNYRGK
jgi:hypothetical protein